jgi:mono/diheme cytochrome c family protein
VVGLVLLAATGGCMQATTLGDQPPDVVVVGTPPTWQNGIQELMTLKCAVCHTIPRQESAPTNIPGDLNLSMLAYQGNLRGAEDVALAMAEGILRKPIYFAPNMMPLAFSTPLVASEIAALETWGATVTAPPAGTQSIADGQRLYVFYCQQCHGSDAKSGPAHKNLGTSTASEILSAINDNGNIMYTWPGLRGSAPALASDAARLTAIEKFLTQFP